ncbi:MAG: transcriptional regulator with GAF, ATPase, and Fis domain [Planctomycetota bacterium]|jgi:transcriptional regulator with GAF, ATPase, and Fis domain/tetratricopeptide (TPR) repeat protein
MCPSDANNQPPDPGVDLPVGVSFQERLATGPDAVVDRVTWQGQACVLRTGGQAASGPLWEAAALQRLADPGLPKLLEHGQTPRGRPYLLRSWVDGQPLDEALRAASLEQATAHLHALLATLESLHLAGFVVRDLKAENILVSERPVVFDLDLARRDSRAERVGSAWHMAPETLLQQAYLPAADLFSLGATVAIAYAGKPTGSLANFPRRPFLEAAGLDLERVPLSLRPLVQALVRRHAPERPASARAAASLLPGSSIVASLPELPALAGREQEVRSLAERLVGVLPPALVALASPAEVHELGSAIQLEVALLGKLARLWRIHDHLDEVGLEQLSFGGGPQLVLLGEQAPEAAVLELLDAGRSHGLLVLTDTARAERLAAVSGIQLESFPGMSAEVIEQHLEHLSGDTAPMAAQRLARSLHQQAQGDGVRIRRALAEAEALGVVRLREGALDLLHETWPELADSTVSEGIEALGDSARELLMAMALLGDRGDLEQARQVAQLDPKACAAATAELAQAGLLGADGATLTPAQSGLMGETLLSWHGRAAAVLQAAGAPVHEAAAHLLPCAQSCADLEQVLAGADDARRVGRLGRARELARGVLAHAAASDALQGEALVRLARMELAAGGAERALDMLRERFGDELASAPAGARVAAGEAATLAGLREEARAIWSGLLESAPDVAFELRALTGLAHGDLLDGNPQAALERTKGRPRKQDPHEAAGMLLNLQAGALSQLGRGAAAEAALDQAASRAEVSGDPQLRGRTALNRAFRERRRGRPLAALALLDQARADFHGTEDVRQRALAFNNSGVACCDLGELARAEGLLRRALSMRRRVGDLHGAASSLGSLGLLALDAGRLAEGERQLMAARDAFARGEWSGELSLMELGLALHASLCGDWAAAEERLGEARCQDAIRVRPALALRVRALARWAAGDAAAARSLLEEACEPRGDQHDAAEGYRAAATWLSLAPQSEAAVQALGRANTELGSKLRQVESDWRLRDRKAQQVDGLKAFLGACEEAGRVDLCFAVSSELARAERGLDPMARRAARARAEAARDSLLEGCSEGAAAGRLTRLQLLAGGDPTPEARLAVDWLVACSQRMAREEDLEALLLAIVDMAIELTGAQRGFVALYKENRPWVRVARGKSGEEGSLEAGQLSNSILIEAARTGEAIITANATEDPRFESMASVANLSLRSVLCVPFAPSGQGASAGTGALYLEDDQRSAVFDDADLEGTRALADQASIAIRRLQDREQILALNERLNERVRFQEGELREARSLLRRKGRVAPVGGLVGESAPMRSLYGMIDRLAPTGLPILITGPSGVGKDLVARGIHQRSSRANGPLVVENMAAIPAALLESELFGHERGAFTGATRGHAGLFAEASGGTFFMDEIGELPLDLQAKLLRALEQGEVRPVGASKSRKVDVRIVAATNRDLAARVSEGAFRSDLFYRLDVAEIRVPSLTQRVEDIPLLVRHFLGLLAEREEQAKEMSPKVLAALMQRTWPGEVRELQNEVARLFYLSGPQLNQPELVRAAAETRAGDQSEPMSFKLEDMERAAVRRALEAAGGKKEQAAKLLGISRAGLYTKLKRLGI